MGASDEERVDLAQRRGRSGVTLYFVPGALHVTGQGLDVRMP